MQKLRINGNVGAVNKRSNAMSLKSLIVYLDSSDISLLSNPLKRSKELVKIETALLDLQSKGLIEFRFSQIHIIEAAPKDEGSVEFAKQRLNYIHKLCNKKCLTSYVNVLEHEIFQLSENYDGSKMEFHNDESKWYPQLDRSESISFKSIIDEQINAQSGREQKRMFKRRLLTKSGEVKREVINHVNLCSPTSIKEVMDKYPVTYDEASSCLKALLNGDSESQVMEILEKSFSEVNRLPAWYEMQWDRIIPISSFLREIGSSLQSSTQQFYFETKDNYEKCQLLGWDEKEIKEKLNGIFRNIKETMPVNFVKKMAENLGFTISIDKLSWVTAPSILTAITVSYHITQKSLYVGGTSRTFKVSDFGDISHTFHLPQVDIFRVDAFIASVIKEANLPFNTSVVGNLNDLLEAIHKRLDVL